MERAAPEIGHCRVCGAPGGIHVCDTPNEHSKTRTLSTFSCVTCGSVFIGNAVDGEELGVAYGSLDTAAYYDEIAHETRRKMATATDDLRRLVPLDAEVIDVGTGDGLFVEMMHAAGFKNLSAHEIAGADLSRIAGIAKKAYLDFDYTTIPSDAFDAVTMLDVTEHVLAPRYLMDQCARILKPGGLIYFHTPVVTRLDRVMHRLDRLPVLQKVGRSWQRGRTSIFHLQNYTPRALRMILERAGYREIQIAVRNELSWPVGRYVRTYLLEKNGLPAGLAPLLAPLAYPVLATDLFNANKALVSARKAATSPIS